VVHGSDPMSTNDVSWIFTYPRAEDIANSPITYTADQAGKMQTYSIDGMTDLVWFDSAEERQIYIDSNGTAGRTIDPTAFTATITEGVYNTTYTFYVTGTIQHYTVNYHLDSDTEASTPQDIYCNQFTPLTTIEDLGFTKAGSSFVGWAYTGMENPSFTDGQSVKNLAAANESIDLYGIWNSGPFIVYIVSSDTKMGSVNPAFISGVETGSIFTVDGNNASLSGQQITATAKDGYEFVNWMVMGADITDSYQMKGKTTVVAAFQIAVVPDDDEDSVYEEESEEMDEILWLMKMRQTSGSKIAGNETSDHEMEIAVAAGCVAVMCAIVAVTILTRQKP